MPLQCIACMLCIAMHSLRKCWAVLRKYQAVLRKNIGLFWRNVELLHAKLCIFWRNSSCPSFTMCSCPVQFLQNNFCKRAISTRKGAQHFISIKEPFITRFFATMFSCEVLLTYLASKHCYVPRKKTLLIFFNTWLFYWNEPCFFARYFYNSSQKSALHDFFLMYP